MIPNDTKMIPIFPSKLFLLLFMINKVTINKHFYISEGNDTKMIHIFLPNYFFQTLLLIMM